MTLYEEIESKLISSSTLDEATEVLEELLSEGYAVWIDGSLYSIKQLVARVKGIQIHIYAKEHAPPHFHVKSPDIDACFQIDDCTFMYGDIGGRDRKLIEWWYARSKPLLISTWNSTRPNDCPVGLIHSK